MVQGCLGFGGGFICCADWDVGGKGKAKWTFAGWDEKERGTGLVERGGPTIWDRRRLASEFASDVVRGGTRSLAGAALGGRGGGARLPAVVGGGSARWRLQAGTAVSGKAGGGGGGARWGRTMAVLLTLSE
uniref:Uncharacterized protein n=1 Tax=Oryza punctata TaxID=4537 RepID=A0A0E0L2P8_ORYPU